MARIAAALFAILLGLTPGAAAAQDAVEVVGPTLTKRVPPRYPAQAIERGQEGWVDVRFTITPEGTTSDVRVVAAYPRGVFDKSAANAVAKWVYAPRMENGQPVPQIDNQAVLSFALAESAAIRDPLAPNFAAAGQAVRERRWDDALGLMKKLMDTDALSLFELAAIEQLRGQIAFGRQDYRGASDAFSRALSITARFDPETRSGISEMLVMAAINAGEFPRAVQAFDAWNPPAEPETQVLRQTVETIRAALASGRQIEVKPIAAGP